MYHRITWLYTWNQHSIVNQQCVCAQLLSLGRFFVTPWTVAHQAPLSMEFSRQEYWSVFPFPIPGYLPDPGIEPVSPASVGRFFTTELPGKPTSI